MPARAGDGVAIWGLAGGCACGSGWDCGCGWGRIGTLAGGRGGSNCAMAGLAHNSATPSAIADGVDGFMIPSPSPFRRPWLVIAGRLGPPILGERRTGRAVGGGRASEIGAVGLPPGLRLDLLDGWRRIDRVVDPAMPSRTDGRSLCQPLIDHPAPLKAERRIDSAPLGAIVAIAVLI